MPSYYFAEFDQTVHASYFKGVTNSDSLLQGIIAGKITGAFVNPEYVS